MSPPKQAHESEKARRSALTVLLVVLTAMILCCLIYRPSSGGIVRPEPYAVGALASAVLALLLLRFRRPPVLWSGIAMAAGIVVANTAAIPAQIALARSARPYEPFVGIKLSVLVVALASPLPRWIARAVIITAGFLSLLEYYVFIPEEVRGNVPIPEPWTTVLYGLIAYLILDYRIRQDQKDEERIRAREEWHAAEKRTKIFLAIRDFANTPLQILELTAHLIQHKAPEARVDVERLRYSLSRLKELSSMLSKYEAEIRWSKENLSFDAVSLLESERSKKP